MTAAHQPMPRGEKAATLAGQLKLLHRRSESGLPVTVTSILRAALLAAEIEEGKKVQVSG